MSPTLQLFKYTLFGIFYIVACLIMLIVKNSRYDIVETKFELRNETISTGDYLISNSRKNASELSEFFNLEETIVRIDELERGKPIDPQEINRSLRRVHETCKKYNKTDILEKRHFLYSRKHGALYCWIRKVASTSFTKFFGELRGIRVARNSYKQIKFLAPETLEELGKILQDKSVFKFLLVRHPFERLVSAYRDRIADNSRYTAQAFIYTPRIFRLTRPGLFHSNATMGNALQQIFASGRRLKLIPTFAEFVTWLLNEPSTNDDVHWYRYNEHCSLCTVKYDYILKLENYTLNEINYMYRKIGIDDKRTELPKLQSTRGGSTNFPLTCDYFASISRENTLKLYDRYRIDFEMFDYKYEDYANCADRSDSKTSKR